MLPRRNRQGQHNNEQKIFLEEGEFEFVPAAILPSQHEMVYVRPRESNPPSDLDSNELEEPVVKQSQLHNCPKNLLRIIVLALELDRHNTREYEAALPKMDPAERTAFKSLLGLLWKARKEQIKNQSKAFLKVVFETGSEKLEGLKPMQNPIIRRCFDRLNGQGIDQAKTMLRAFTFQRLNERRDELIEESRVGNKELMMNYVETFMKELVNGVIHTRMSRAEKERVVRVAGNAQ